MIRKILRNSSFCRWLGNECILDELDEFMNGYEVVGEYSQNGIKSYSLDNGKDKVTLSISSDEISVVKEGQNSAERIVINSDQLLRHTILEKRERGVIYSTVNKFFSVSKRYGRRWVLSDLEEERYAFSEENLNKLFSDKNNLGTSYTLLNMIRMLGVDTPLKDIADNYESFSTHMNYYILGNGRSIKNSAHPTTTYLNDSDVSFYYNVEGPDKLYRVYDLFRGIISPRCERDIKDINMGFLDIDAFDLCGLRGISNEEEKIAGKKLDSDDEYLEYLKNFFDKELGYTGEIQLNRNSLITAIAYRMSGPERAKRSVEKIIGMPYDEFDKLDYDEQRLIIEKAKGKKIEYDTRYRIDGIPCDNEHMMTIEDVDRRLDTKPKSKVLTRIINKFTNKKGQ